MAGKKKFEPRKYQLKCFELAKKQNVIIVLDTGLGKTFISAMLANHIGLTDHQVKRREGKRRLMFFLVNSVPLVLQQSNVFRTHTNLRVGHYYGDMGVDFYSEEDWNLIFSQLDILVMTADILKDLLVHGFIKMEEISLLIFDECHHSRKKHSFNVILADYYHSCPRDMRPKIFGMSASPINRKETVNTSILQLEANLDATAFTLSPDTDGLSEYSFKPREYIHFIEKSNDSDIGPHLSAFLRVAGCEKFEKLKSKLTTMVEELGSSPVELFLHNNIKLMTNYEVLNPGFENWEDSDKVKFKEDIISTLKLMDKLEKPNGDPTRVSPKLKALISIVKKFAKDDKEFSALVFVEKRWNAYSISVFMDQLPKFDGLIRPGLLIGHGGGFMKADSMNAKEQSNVVTKMKMGEYNLLVTTSVGEEGLDIPACSTVIRFDLPQTLTSYIQSRGRARRKNSSFVLLVNRDAKEESLLQRIKSSESEFRIWQQFKLEGEFENLLKEESDDDGDLELVSSENEIFEVPSTGASVSYYTSLEVLHYFCATVPHDIYFQPNPEFEYLREGSLFCVNIQMPLSCPIRTIQGKYMRSKNLAKRSACLEAIKIIHEANLLDDHLLPARTRVKGLDISKSNQLNLLEGVDLDEEDLKDYVLSDDDQKFRLELPWNFETWDLNDDLYIQNLHFDGNFEGYAPMSIISPAPLREHSFNMFLPDQTLFDKSAKVQVGASKKIKMDLFQVNRLRRFNSFVMRYVFLSHRQETGSNKPDYIWEKINFDEWDENYIYLFVPTLKDEIDWETIENIEIYESAFQQEGDNGKFLDVLSKLPREIWDSEEWIVTDIIDYQRKMVVHEINWDMSPKTKVLDEDLNDPNAILPKRSFETYEGWYASANKRIPYTKIRLPTNHEKQPLCKCKRAPLLKNYLVPEILPSYSARTKSKLPSYRIPEYLIFSPIPAPVFRSAVLFPALISRIESVSLACKFKESYKLEEIPLNLILQALTAPSANLGYSYESLETLGDAFLKIAISLDLFIKYPDRDEGRLSYPKHLLVSNAALYRRAKTLNLHKYIWTKPIVVKGWRLPLASEANSVRKVTVIPLNKRLRKIAVPQNGSLSFATVADVVESLLGAAYVTGGVELGIKMMNLFGIPLENVERWSDYRFIPPLISSDEPKINAEVVEDIIEYHFTNTGLLEIALNHSSSQYRDIPSYERFEFLGDAVLELIVVSELFFIHREDDKKLERFPDFIPPLALLPPASRKRVESEGFPLDPGRLTDIKMLTVNNDTLGFVAIARGLNRHLNFFSEDLFNAIKNCALHIDQMMKTELQQVDDDTLSFDALPWWWYDAYSKNVDKLVEQQMNYVATDSAELEIDELNFVENEIEENLETEKNIPETIQMANVIEMFSKASPKKWPATKLRIPKAAGDIVEAIIGAVFLDCHMNLDVVRRVVNKLMGLSSSELPRSLSEENLTPNDLNSKQKDSVKISLVDWIRNNSWELLYQRLHPLRKLQEYADSKSCTGICFKKFNVVRNRGNFFNYIGHDENTVEIGTNIPEYLYSLKEAEGMEKLKFEKYVCGVYYHDMLLGIAADDSYKEARSVASKEALVTINHILLRQDSHEGSIRMDFGIDCDLCSAERRQNAKVTSQA